ELEREERKGVGLDRIPERGRRRDVPHRPYRDVLERDPEDIGERKFGRKAGAEQGDGDNVSEHAAGAAMQRRKENAVPSSVRRVPGERAAQRAIEVQADQRKIQTGHRPHDVHDLHVLRMPALVRGDDERRQYAQADGGPGERLQDGYALSTLKRPAPSGGSRYGIKR